MYDYVYMMIFDDITEPIRLKYKYLYKQVDNAICTSKIHIQWWIWKEGGEDA